MDRLNNVESSQLTEAVLVWTGYGRDKTPRRRADLLLAEHFGPELAARLLPLIKSLKDDFYLSDARQAGDLEEVGNLAAEYFRMKHPGIAEEVVKAFTWCYTWDWR
jgi:hypothetical protein